MKKGESVKQHLADGCVEQFLGNPLCETLCTTCSALETGLHETLLAPYHDGIK